MWPIHSDQLVFMKVAYLDCLSGISGDMALAALIDAGAPIDLVESRIKSLALPEFELCATEVKRKGFRAKKIEFAHAEQHAHRHLSDILALIKRSELSNAEANLAEGIFQNLAKAEAAVHGSTIEKVHFHEVGAVDSIGDIVGTAVALNWLGIEKTFCSRIPFGAGSIEIDHGKVSLPAPATAQLLIGIPTYQTEIPHELTTPTGAAIAKTIVEQFGLMPAMAIQKIGVGAGTRDLPGQANVLRISLGEMTDAELDGRCETEQIVKLETNLDDCSGEVIGHCYDRLLEAGALDVFTAPIAMKKNRPAVLLTVLCRPDQVGQLQDIIFGETTTLGIRRETIFREVLPREAHTVETIFGPIVGKRISFDGKARFEPEFENCKELAIERGIPVQTVMAAAHRGFDQSVDES